MDARLQMGSLDTDKTTFKISKEAMCHDPATHVIHQAFIPRGWNLFFSGTGTADFHPEVLEKARPISPLR